VIYGFNRLGKDEQNKVEEINGEEQKYVDNIEIK